MKKLLIYDYYAGNYTYEGNRALCEEYAADALKLDPIPQVLCVEISRSRRNTDGWTPAVFMGDIIYVPDEEYGIKSVLIYPAVTRELDAFLDGWRPLFSFRFTTYTMERHNS